MGKTFEDAAQPRHSGMVRLTFAETGDPAAFRASSILNVVVDQRDRLTTRVFMTADAADEGIPVGQTVDEVLALMAEAGR